MNVEEMFEKHEIMSPMSSKSSRMQVKLTFNLTDEQVKKIGWGGLYNYADQETTEEDVTDYLEASVRDMIEDMPLPPE